MDTNKTLLRVPELMRAVKPLVSFPITHKDIFQLIGTGDIKPLGFIQRIPVFDITQVSDVAKVIETKSAKDLQREHLAVETSKEIYNAVDKLSKS